MRENVRQKILRYVVLMAGILALISVVVPHHHHRDGMPCYKVLTDEQSQDSTRSDTHHCSCDGHNLAYLNIGASSSVSGDVMHHLVPLSLLFDYVYPPEPAFRGQLLYRGYILYVEALRDSWIVSASGLRAPPMS